MPFIRWMIRADMPAVLGIAGACKSWSEQDFLTALRQRECIGMIAEDGDKLKGYVVYALGKDYVSILALAVHPDHRREGVGRALLGKIASKLSPAKRQRAVWDVSEWEDGIHLFLKACGWEAGCINRAAEWDGADTYHFVLWATPDEEVLAQADDDRRDAECVEEQS